MKKHCCLILILFSLSTAALYAQISEGGYPLDVSPQKSVSLVTRSIFHTPRFDRAMIPESAPDPVPFKSVRFAHPFPVQLRPDNSGIWYDAGAYRVWQLSVVSGGAYSVQIIFSRYRIPQGARLFLFDARKEFVLGAFTCRNNKSFGKLAVYPVPGDSIIIQYEVPADAADRGELEIGTVYHDYADFFGLKNRVEPRRLSGACNVDINCCFDNRFKELQQAVCRIVAAGELGTGTLLNNASNDRRPLLISAYHVFKKTKNAEESIFDFNYESPFCTGINGSDLQSVSGATTLASFDSLDFILVELSELPPPSYRPYLAGWDARTERPSACFTLHHPNGDTKKVSYDEGICDSARYNKNYINYGHWKVHNWESGTTEGGSSGAGLFNPDMRLTGTLSGGNASCTVNSYDLFSRFDKVWNYRPEKNQQVACWLGDSTESSLFCDGMDPYESEEEACTVISNFFTDDLHCTIPVPEGGTGILTGNNTFGITELAERFNDFSTATLQGVSIGIASFRDLSDEAELILRIYTGDSLPSFAEKQYRFPFGMLTPSAMNYFAFPEPLVVSGTFFISVVVPGMDSLALFQSDRRHIAGTNTFLVLHNGAWKEAHELAGSGSQGLSLLMQVVVCGASPVQPNDTTWQDESLFRLYPNPARNYIVLEFTNRLSMHNVKLFDLAGKLLQNEQYANRMYAEMDVSSFSPGIYLVCVEEEDGKTEIRKVVISGL